MTRAQLAPSAMEAKALVAIRARVSDLDLLVRHVRGHKRGQQRQWVNRMCDAEARRHMLAERARLEVEVGRLSRSANVVYASPVRLSRPTTGGDRWSSTAGICRSPNWTDHLSK